MEITFEKFQGTGNDFILIDNRNGLLNKENFTAEQIKFLCNRRFGIGADGLMLLNDHGTTDFEMEYFNADGSTSTMCGNGGRCIVAFAYRLHAFSGKKCRFKAVKDIYEAEITQGAPLWVKLHMQDIAESDIEKHDNYSWLHTGSPHHVEFVENSNELDIISTGRKIRFDEKYQPQGTNVNFVEFLPHKIHVKTYERGVEDLTLSCGTGVVASALASYLKKPELKPPIDIETPGGHLKVFFAPYKSGFKNIWLEGPANFVFKGNINIE